ncbi:ATP-dependent nuclease [Corynebacterium matruchotii]|jgi:RecF/RecN/SMC N terminal domain.|uniref:RecF/RecN/SMC N-terminal domain protein n=1 Tax=Corynebacterium matruchotii ATCC 33806 TaxID=566549 RepID=C0E1U9_9CORY|nr:AAA family ATPase [Corynebacterium matruchotii]EEG27523.1 hypothetical protein CORMATOL_00953 [Corynebacterium matruchotii ATCC 33806]
MMITKIHIQGYRKLKEFLFEPNNGMNIIVGGNDAGKSTLLEAISLCLTGRINGQRASDVLNPYWFNTELVAEFFAARKNNQTVPPPEIRIELHLEVSKGELENMRGVNNMKREDAAGLSMWIHPDPEYLEELDEYFSQVDCPPIIPIEYYLVEWKNFAGTIIFNRPKGLGVAVINSRTIRSDRGMDFYTKQLLESKLDPKDRNKVSVKHRQLRNNLGSELIEDINTSLHENLSPSESGRWLVGLQIDQSRSTSWESTLIPEIDRIPFSMSGQGAQVIAKASLALSQSEDSTSFLLIEEPENHLTHTRLRELLSIIERNSMGRQVFITTHSSYVLNRLGLNQLVLLHGGSHKSFSGLSKETTEYFQLISGFDTLRLVLADKMVIVEGPSDEIIFNHFFKDKYGREPMAFGIDVMSIRGTSFLRSFELASLLDRQLIALRDNDGQEPEHWIKRLEPFLLEGKRQMFIGNPEDGRTLEPQILTANPHLCETNGDYEKKLKKMQDNKTATALNIAQSDEKLTPPPYFKEAIAALMKNTEVSI